MSIRKLFRGGITLIIFDIMVSFLFIELDKPKDYSKLTNSEVLNLPIDELADLPFEELIKISENFNFWELKEDMI